MSYFGSCLKSIQRGTIDSGVAGSNTQAVTAVTVANSILRLISETAVGAPNATAKFGRLVLSSSTLISMLSAGDNVTDTARIGFELIEFKSFVKSVQQVTVSMAPGVFSANAALSAVVTGKSLIFYQGAQITVNTSGGNLDDEVIDSLAFASTTLVTFTRRAASNNTVTFGAVVIEFK